MRIAFICSNLEPGKDGVGDYVTELAVELQRQEHECIAVSLADSKEGRFERCGISLRRISSSNSWTRRIALARMFVDEFRADWTSLQFVSYGFHQKGLPVGLLGSIPHLFKGCRLHVYLHELWLGEAKNAPLRHRVVGFLQRLLILRLLKVLAPQIVHTNTPVYEAVLQDKGIEANVLPLFGNIPVSPELLSKEQLQEFLPEYLVADRDEYWIGGFFGTLHPEWEPEPLMSDLLNAARRTSKKLCLLSIGRLGVGEGRWAELGGKYEDRCRFVRVGEASPSSISYLLRNVDFGVSATPWQLIGKSGTTASMLDHGIPVIVTRDDFIPRLSFTRNPTDDPLLIKGGEGLGEVLTKGLPRRKPRSRCTEVASSLVKMLQLKSDRSSIE